MLIGRVESPPRYEGCGAPQGLAQLGPHDDRSGDRSAISPRSHWAMAAVIVEKSRLAGELVSMASWREIRLHVAEGFGRDAPRSSREKTKPTQMRGPDSYLSRPSRWRSASVQ